MQSASAQIHPHRYPKAVRLRLRRNFCHVEEQGKRCAGQYIAISFIKKKGGATRLGITVTRRYGKAHDRNRFKRCVREAFRLVRQQLPSHFDIVVKPRHKALQVDTATVMREMVSLLSGPNTTY